MAYDLEEQESLDQLKAWWDKWGNLTLGLITVGCLAFAAWNGWNYYQRHQGAKASAAFIQLQNAYVNNDTKGVVTFADGLMKEYPSHVFASLGALVKAAADAQAGNIDASRTTLQWVIDQGKPQYETVAKLRLAGLELDAKNYDKALSLVQSISGEAATSGAVLDRLGDIYLARGEIENARKTWKQLIDNNTADDSDILPFVALKYAGLPDPVVQ